MSTVKKNSEKNTRNTMRRLARHVSPLALAAAATITMTPGAALAQQGVGALEEIVVTARFRSENIQTTPIAITALSGDDLDMRSITNVEEVGLVVPNAFFRQNVGNYGPTGTIGLRGITQNDFSYAFEPAVAIYIDDVYHGTMTGSDMDLIDLERLEVLRGPQGTLFGKNSIGGAVRLISRKPEGDNTGRVEVTYGSYDRLDLKAVGDFTLVEDRVFARIVGVSEQRDGYGKRLDFTCDMIRRGTPELAGIGDGLAADGAAGGAPDGQPDSVTPGSPADNAFALPQTIDQRGTGDCSLGTYGGEQSDAARLQVRVIASDKLEINLSGDFTQRNDEPLPQGLLTPYAGGFDAAYDAGVIVPAYGVPYTQDDRFVTDSPYDNYATFSDPLEGQSYDPISHMEAWGVSGVVDYDATDNIHAKGIVAYRTYRTRWTSDTDFMPYPVQQTDNVQDHDQWQFELQLTGTSLDDALEWTVGAFYYDSDSRAFNTTEFGAFDYSGLLTNFVANDFYTTRNKSGFVHLVYNLTNRLSLSGGLRYTDEHKTNIFDHQPGTLPVIGPVPFDDTRWDWKVSADYQASDSIFLYAQAATGFRSAGFTPRVFTVGQLKAIPPEEVLTYEVGAKFDLLDNRVRLNTAAFYSDYDPRLIQLSGVNQCDAPTDPDPQPYFLQGGVCPPGTALAGGTGLPWFYYGNAPGAIKGIEAELQATPTENLNLNFTVGYNTYSNDEDDPTSPSFRDPSALLQPEWNMSGGVEYLIPVMGNSGSVTPRLDWFYQSHRTNGAANQPNICPEECIPGYHLFNGRITYDNLDHNFSLSFAVTNIFDKFYWQQLDAAVSATGGVPSARTGVPSRPREWSISATKRF